jgi:hypothetical protein
VGLLAGPLDLDALVREKALLVGDLGVRGDGLGQAHQVGAGSGGSQGKAGGEGGSERAVPHGSL